VLGGVESAGETGTTIVRWFFPVMVTTAADTTVVALHGHLGEHRPAVFLLLVELPFAHVEAVLKF